MNVTYRPMSAGEDLAWCGTSTFIANGGNEEEREHKDDHWEEEMLFVC